jgi:hypothetical protein
VSPLELSSSINDSLILLYNAIRLDLGVIRPNQIYNDSAKYNATVGGHASVVAPNFMQDMLDTISHVNLSDPTYSVHVPLVLYLTPVFKLKPLPQAITAVFVATFSMLSAIWAVFNFTASSFVTRRSKHGQHLVFFVLLIPY